MPEFSSLAQLPLFTNSLLDWSMALGIASVALVVLLMAPADGARVPQTNAGDRRD